jgi:hypothetical protein
MVAGSTLLEGDCGLGNLLRHARFKLVHKVPPSRLRLSCTAVDEKKPTWSDTPGVLDHVGLLVNGPPGAARLPLI